jgi:hypothetical protein
LVPGNTTLRRLDRIIQTAMGWTNSHLHTFTAGGVLYADSHAEWEIDVKDERRVRLESIAKGEGEAFVYEYDMGDSWRHQVLVEEVRWGRFRWAGVPFRRARVPAGGLWRRPGLLRHARDPFAAPAMTNTSTPRLGSRA